jgi:hypothetical protein
MDLTQPPALLTSRQRAIVLAVAVVCALSRFAAMARSLWDWDEALFCLGMRSFDVALHHPHPPGFPAFIAMGRFVRLFLHDDFRSLQALNLIAGMLLFPAMFLLARELRLRFETALVAAALCAFLPNVWFFGGTAFSDIPSLTLVVFAVAMLFRGCRDDRAYIAGAFLLGVAAGIRPQNLLVGAFPALLSTWYRARVSWRDVIFAILVGGTVVAASFGGAMVATGGPKPYLAAVRLHSEYISHVDSFRSPDRPPLWRLFDRFFLTQYQSLVLGLLTSVLVIVGVVESIRRPDRRIGFLALTFGPFAVTAWLMLDRYSINRFSIGYCPMFVILAAEGIACIARQRTRFELAAGGVLIACFIAYTLPALTVVRNEISPSIRAVQAIPGTIDLRRDQLFVGEAMTPFMEYVLPYQPYARVHDERALPLSADPRRHPWLLTELHMTTPGGLHFHRPHDHLWNIARRHFFDVGLEPIRELPELVSGWYPPERYEAGEWRWMAGHSVTRMHPQAGDALLYLAFDVPDELMARPPVITVTLNGAIIDRFPAPEAHLIREYNVQGAANAAPNVLELDVDHSLNPARQHLGDDTRELGLLVRSLSWGPG